MNAESSRVGSSRVGSSRDGSSYEASQQSSTWSVTRGLTGGLFKLALGMVSPSLPLAVSPPVSTTPLNSRMSAQSTRTTVAATPAVNSVLHAPSSTSSSYEEKRQAQKAYFEKRGAELDAVYCMGIWNEFLADGPKKGFQLQKDEFNGYVCVPVQDITTPRALRCPKMPSVSIGEQEYIRLTHPNVDELNILILVSQNYLILLVSGNDGCDYMTFCTKGKLLTYSPAFTGSWENIGKGACQLKQMNNYFKLDIPAPKMA